MTMHLAQGLTTINTKKRKQKKLTEAQRQKLEVEWRQFNKRMRQSNCHSAQFATFDDYVDYTRGVYKPKAQKNVSNRDFLPQKSVQPYRRETPNIPSHGSMVGVAFKKEPMRYTGTLIKGIATMHKSNAVPVIDNQQAKDIANMRRN